MTSYPRGKPTTPARPGIIIKEVLSGRRALVSGDMVTEAAITDISAVYRDFIYEVNKTRPRDNKLKGMVYSSFLKVFKFAQLLGLVELVREEPMLFPPGNSNLYSVRKKHIAGDGYRVNAVISKRRIFKLSALGEADEVSWTDLCRAWREGWNAPQKLDHPVVLIEPEIIPEPITETEEEMAEEVITPEEEPVVRRGRGRPKGTYKKPREAEEVGTPLSEFSLSKIPSQQQYALLLNRLILLDSIGVNDTNVTIEIGKIAAIVEEWTVVATEQYEAAESKNIASDVFRTRFIRTTTYALSENLLDKNLPSAIGNLQKLLGPGTTTSPIQPPKPNPAHPEVSEFIVAQPKRKAGRPKKAAPPSTTTPAGEHGPVTVSHQTDAEMAIAALEKLDEAEADNAARALMENDEVSEEAISEEKATSAVPKRGSNVDTLHATLVDLMDEDNKQLSVANLGRALTEISVEEYTGMEDVTDAIDGYYDAEADEKDEAFQDVINSIGSIQAL